MEERVFIHKSRVAPRSLTPPYLSHIYDGRGAPVGNPKPHCQRIPGEKSKGIMKCFQDEMPSNGFHEKLSEACLEVFHSSPGVRGAGNRI